MKTIFKLIVVVFYGLQILSCSNTTSPESNKPSDLQIILIENNLIKLNWQDNSNDETKFIIDRKKGEDDWFDAYNEVAENITTFNDFIPTESDTVYSYRVRAYNGNDYSDYSIPAGWFSDYTAPNNLDIEQVAQDSIKLSWFDNSIGELNFRIDRKIEGEEWIEGYKIIEENEEQYIDFNNELYAPCYYRISSCSGHSSSTYDEGYIHAFNPPTNLIVSLLDNVAFLLEWDDNSNYETGYKIERKKENEEYALLDSVGQNINTYIDNSIEEFTKYYYRIYGFNQEFQTDYSNIANATWYTGIIYVPDYFDEIQSAIDIAHSGDTIIVHPGQYNENIRLRDKNIIIASDYLITGNPEVISQTIINGIGGDSVFDLRSGINDSTLICGFTISGGYDTGYGGGINCHGSPTLSNLIITWNGSDNEGGGIYCEGNAKLEYLTISNNGSFKGGGIYFADGNPTLENSIIIDNGSTWGGGLYVLSSSEVEIKKVIFENNYAPYGSALYSSGEPLFNNAIFRDHDTDDAIYLSSSNTTFINTIIDDTKLVACTNSYVTFINCITDSDNLAISDMGNGATFEISYCDIIGGQSGINIGNYGVINWLEGNINLDPLFIGYDDYHLQSGSPCIDAGHPDPQYNDPDGTRNDMGAYGGPSGNW
jgi:hypothetical protein